MKTSVYRIVFFNRLLSWIIITAVVCLNNPVTAGVGIFSSNGSECLKGSNRQLAARFSYSVSKSLLFRNSLPFEDMQAVYDAICADIEATPYDSHGSSDERIASFKAFVESQAEQAGIMLQERSLSFVEFNKLRIKDIKYNVSLLVRACKERLWKNAARQVPLLCAHMVFFLFQFQPPSVHCEYNEKGRIIIQYKAAGISLYLTSVLIFIAAGVITHWSYGLLLGVVSAVFYLYAGKREHYGHELSHVYQIIVMEKIRKELGSRASGLDVAAFHALLPEAARVKTVDAPGRGYLRNEPPSKERLKSIARQIFIDMRPHIAVLNEADFKPSA